MRCVDCASIFLSRLLKDMPDFQNYQKSLEICQVYQGVLEENLRKLPEFLRTLQNLSDTPVEEFVYYQVDAKGTNYEA